MNSKTGDAGASELASASPMKRRNWVLGVGAAGAAALAVKALPGAPAAAPVVAVAQTAVDQAGGYRLTAHVQRYYDTTRT